MIKTMSEYRDVLVAPGGDIVPSALSAAVVPGRNGQPMVTSHHHSGSSVDVYLFGATMTSFRTAAGMLLLPVVT